MILRADLLPNQHLQNRLRRQPMAERRRMPVFRRQRQGRLPVAGIAALPQTTPVILSLSRRILSTFVGPYTSGIATATREQSIYNYISVPIWDFCLDLRRNPWLSAIIRRSESLFCRYFFG